MMGSKKRSFAPVLATWTIRSENEERSEVVASCLREDVTSFA